MKTLISHMKKFGVVDSMKSGTYLTNKGKKFSQKFFEVILNECDVPNSTFLTSTSNHAIILRDYAHAIKSGIEQRDYAIMYGAKSAITLVFKNNNFVFPDQEKIAMQKDKKHLKK